MICIIAQNGHHHHLLRRQFGWQFQPVIIGVGHDDGTNHACGKAPAGGVGQHHIARAILEFNVGGARKILPQIMAGAGLQRASILHHGFDGEGVHGTRKTLGRNFFAGHHGQGRHVHGKILIHAVHFFGLKHRIIHAFVHGVPLLP